MKAGRFLRLLLRILVWGFAGLVSLLLLWFAANRLLDERPDPRRDAFVNSGESVPDAENIAVGVAGLGAPHGADFMKFGAEVKKLYDQHAPWPETQGKYHDELKVTVGSMQLDCWDDPDWQGPKECLPFDKAPQALAENSEMLRRYKSLYKLERYESFGASARDLIPLTKLAIVEMRLDTRGGNYEAAYAKWRENFRFTKNYLRGQDDWVGKTVGLVDLAISFSVIEDLMVKKPSLARTHSAELLELLRPEGIAMINPDGVARAQYLQVERFFETPYTSPPEYEDRIGWLAWHLGQPRRFENRYLAFSMDYAAVLRQPWPRLPEEFARMRGGYDPSFWDVLIDPFGSLFFLEHTYWEMKPLEVIRYAYLRDGRLRLATLVVRMLDGRVKDEDIPGFLAKAGAGLFDPISGKPMQWDAKNGRIYFPNGDDKCSITPFRVPVWDVKSKRHPPREADWRTC